MEPKVSNPESTVYLNLVKVLEFKITLPKPVHSNALVPLNYDHFKDNLLQY